MGRRKTRQHPGFIMFSSPRAVGRGREMEAMWYAYASTTRSGGQFAYIMCFKHADCVGYFYFMRFSSQVKKWYRKAVLSVHPDKVRSRVFSFIFLLLNGRQ